MPHNLDKPLVALILLETENKSAEAIVRIITGMLHFVLLEDVECVCFSYKKVSGLYFFTLLVGSRRVRTTT